MESWTYIAPWMELSSLARKENWIELSPFAGKDNWMDPADDPFFLTVEFTTSVICCVVGHSVIRVSAKRVLERGSGARAER